MASGTATSNPTSGPAGPDVKRRRALAIGIDFGTTSSSIAIFRNGKVEIIPNDLGNLTTPSCIAFNDHEHLVGEKARNRVTGNSSNTITDAKQFLGRRYADIMACNGPLCCRHQSYTVVKDTTGKPRFRVKCRGNQKDVHAELASSLVLSKLKNAAEVFTGEEVKDVVITVPVTFTICERQALQDSASIAGLNVLRLTSDPSAAAYAYGFNKIAKLSKKDRLKMQKQAADGKHLLIFCLGAGFLSVSVVQADGIDIYDVRATAGNENLGGNDFDDRLLRHFLEEFKLKRKEDMTTNQRAVERLRKACESAKRQLSSTLQAEIQLEALFEGIDFKASITRHRFEELCADLFQATLAPVEEALKDARTARSNISEILLVGACTRIPMIEKLLKEFFGGRDILNKAFNPTGGVVGAALQAATVLGDDVPQELRGFLLLDVTPNIISVGSLATGRVFPLIKRNCSIPTRQQQIFQTYPKDSSPRKQRVWPTLLLGAAGLAFSGPLSSNELPPLGTSLEDPKELSLCVLEGSRALVKEDSLFDEFPLTDILSVPRQVEDIKVAFDIDASGILSVTATNQTNGRHKSVIFSRGKFNLAVEEVGSLVKEAEEYRLDEQKQASRAAAKDTLESFIFATKLSAEDPWTKDSSTENGRKAIIQRCDEVLEWLDAHEFAEEDQIKEKQKELDAFCREVSRKASEEKELQRMRDEVKKLLRQDMNEATSAISAIKGLGKPNRDTLDSVQALRLDIKKLSSEMNTMGADRTEVAERLKALEAKISSMQRTTEDLSLHQQQTITQLEQLQEIIPLWLARMNRLEHLENLEEELDATKRASKLKDAALARLEARVKEIEEDVARFLPSKHPSGNSLDRQSSSGGKTRGSHQAGSEAPDTQEGAAGMDVSPELVRDFMELLRKHRRF